MQNKKVAVLHLKAITCFCNAKLKTCCYFEETIKNAKCGFLNIFSNMYLIPAVASGVTDPGPAKPGPHRPQAPQTPVPADPSPRGRGGGGDKNIRGAKNCEGVPKKVTFFYLIYIFVVRRKQLFSTFQVTLFIVSRKCIFGFSN